MNLEKAQKNLQTAEADYERRREAADQALATLRAADPDDAAKWHKANAEKDRHLAALGRADQALAAAREAVLQAERSAMEAEYADCLLVLRANRTAKAMESIVKRTKAAMAEIHACLEHTRAVAQDQIDADQRAKELAARLGIEHRSQHVNAFQLLDKFLVPHIERRPVASGANPVPAAPRCSCASKEAEAPP